MAVTAEDLAAASAANEALRAEIEETRAERERREKAAVNETTLASLKAEEASLQSQLAAAKQEVESLPAVGNAAAPKAAAAVKNEKE